MKLAYIAGPYRDPRGAHYIQENIAKAREVAAELWQKGYAVICPHLNTAHMDGVVDDKTFLDGLIEILTRCDLVVVLPHHETSKGTAEEIYYAGTFEIPLLFWPDVPDAEELK